MSRDGVGSATLAGRARVLAGVAGPTTFIACWAGLGPQLDGYSPVRDPISRLAALGASTRPAMTVGLTVFGVGTVLLSDQLRRSKVGPHWLSIGACGLATLAVAALPLGTSSDTPHLAAAFAAYATLALSPALACLSPSPARGPGRAWRSVSMTAALITGAALAASTVAAPTGLLQRIGLTSGDLWIVALAARTWRRS